MSVLKINRSESKAEFINTANNNNANNVNSVSPDFATLRWEGQTQ